MLELVQNKLRAVPCEYICELEGLKARESSEVGTFGHPQLAGFPFQVAQHQVQEGRLCCLVLGAFWDMALWTL